ncbi:MAG TPA: hypothetical protein EYH14_00715 [Euryarchaeota archaeon]|nr:hypothetical protein [Euryarchaeota archaeon]
MIRISTMFIPYKLVLSEKRPVALEISIKNTGAESRLTSILVEVPYELSLNAGGYVRRKEQRLGTLKPGETKKITFYIFPKPTTGPGDYEIVITAMEHLDDYTYVVGETTKTVTLKVV